MKGRRRWFLVPAGFAAVQPHRGELRKRRYLGPGGDQGDPAVEMGDSCSVWRLLRRQDQRLYRQAGLDVNLKVGGPDISPEQVVAGKQAEFGINWLPSLLAQRDTGTNLVNIAQVCSRSGTTEVTWKDSGINTIKKMKGKKYGV